MFIYKQISIKKFKLENVKHLKELKMPYSFNTSKFKLCFVKFHYINLYIDNINFNKTN